VILQGTPVSMGAGGPGDAGWRLSLSLRAGAAIPFSSTVGALTTFNSLARISSQIRRLQHRAGSAPNAPLGQNLMGLWARTLSWVDGSWVQAERGARASQTPSLPVAERSVAPGAGGRCPFRSALRAIAEYYRGVYAGGSPGGWQGPCWPDLLYYDPTRPASYPDNGRTPSDDAADAFLLSSEWGKYGGWDRPAHDLLAEFPLPGAASQQLA